MKDGKPTGGYDRLKIKYAELERRHNEEVYEHQALEKDRDKWKKDAEAKQVTIDAQSRKHERQLKEMYDHMGWFKRMTWDWHHAPTFKEDERWNETH